MVASATVTLWAGGWEKEGAGRELGYEIKAVCVDGGAQYLRKGLDMKVVGVLEKLSLEAEKMDMRRKISKLNIENLDGAVKIGKKGVLIL